MSQEPRIVRVLESLVLNTMAALASKSIHRHCWSTWEGSGCKDFPGVRGKVLDVKTSLEYVGRF